MSTKFFKKFAVAAIVAVGLFAGTATAQNTATWNSSIPPDISSWAGTDDGEITIETGASETLSLPSGTTVTIVSTGLVDNGSNTIELDIPDNAKVMWKAQISGSGGLWSGLIGITGGGEFDLMDGGMIQSTYTYRTINIENGTITISGGMIQSTGSAITASYTAVTVNGGLIVGEGTKNYPAISATDNSTVTVSGGMVQATGYGGIAISSANNEITVNGGTVQAIGTDGCAIQSYAGLIVSGGIVEATGNSGAAIRGGVTLIDGTVRATGDGFGWAIYAAGGYTVTVNGGIVQRIGDKGSAIYAVTKTKVIINGGTVQMIGDNGSAVNAANCEVTINDGIVQAIGDGGSTITLGDKSSMNISGGIVQAVGNNRLAISTSTSTIRISGGVVFGLGNNQDDLMEYHKNTSNASTITIVDDGIVIALDISAVIGSVFVGTTIGISPFFANVTTSGYARWDVVNNNSGISYSIGANTGFVEVAGVILEHIIWDSSIPPNISTWAGSDVEVTIAAGAAGELVIPENTRVTIDSDGVVDNGSNGIRLKIDPTSIVMWEAQLLGTPSGMEMIFVTNGGKLIVAKGGEIVVTEGGATANAITVSNSTVTVDGGVVEALYSTAIYAINNSMVTIANGVVASTQAVTASNSTVKINGGIVGGIGAYSSTVVVNDGMIESSSIAIGIVNSTVTINGGTVLSTDEFGYAVYSGSSGNTVTINGGVVFGLGTSQEDVILLSGEIANITTSAIVLALSPSIWTESGICIEGSTTGISVVGASGASAAWGRIGGRSGIIYGNGENIGFIEVTSATVTEPPMLIGTASIDKMTPRIGDVLTGSLVGGNNTGTQTYTWKADAVTLGTGTTYIVATADLGKAITLEITSSVETGTVTSAATAAVLKKSAPSAPSVPTILSQTHNSVTLTATAGYEYKIDDGGWAASNVFGDLSPNMEYTFYQRIAETDDTDASAASVALNVTMDAVYTVTFSLPTNGTLTVMNGATAVTSGTSVPHGTVLTITATPNTGYGLSSLTVNGTSFTNSGTHTVTAAVTVSAAFAINTYAVTFTQPSNGTLTVMNGATAVTSGDKVPHGTVLTISVSSDEGYKPATLTVNGATFTSGETHTVTGAVEILASFTTGIASGDRVIPQTKPDNSAVVIPPVNVTAFEITVGPNPVRGSDGVINIFLSGKRVDDGTLTVYDVTGNVINKITIRDNAAIGNNGKRVVGSWDLKDGKGNHVSAGSYLLRGTVKTSDGNRERVSVIVGVR